MQNVRAKLNLLVIALVATAVAQGHWVGAAQIDSIVQQPEMDFIPSEAHVAPAEPEVFADEIGSFYLSTPVWYFRAEGVALRRDAAADRTFAALVNRTWTSATEYTQTNSGALSTGDLNFGYRGGGRALIGRSLGQWSAIEVSYFDVGDWHEIGAVTDNTPFETAQGVFEGSSLFSPFTGVNDDPVRGLDYNNFVSIDYFSSLYNIEWNLRRMLPIAEPRMRGSVLVGGRYMNLSERFSYFGSSIDPVVATNSVTTRTSNDMLGVQVGAQFAFEVDPQWWVDCEIKGVAFDNVARQETNYVHTGAEPAGFAGTHSTWRAENSSSFALDLSLTCTYQISHCLSVRFGYQAIWLDGLALASENLNGDANLLLSGPGILVDTGRAVYHGMNLGAICVW